MNTEIGYVYFLKAEDRPVVKIGKTKNDPKLRRKEIRNMSPVHLYSIGTISGRNYSKLEKEMHELFTPYHHHGEWFEFSDKQVSCLKKTLKVKKEHAAESRPFDLAQFKAFWKREIENDSWLYV